MSDHKQFFPTPRWIAVKMWAAFRDRNFKLVLEPSAGAGDLLAPFLEGMSCPPGVHVIEPDIRRHDRLRGIGATVVGVDFESYATGAGYSHIIMNPPFQSGARHVLHAWDILFDGEIVALLNASTLQTGDDIYRKRLKLLLERHGEVVEHIPDAFSVAEIKANVDCVIIRLEKRSNTSRDVVGDLLSRLRTEHDPRESVDSPVTGVEAQALAIPDDEIENALLCHKAALLASREAIIAKYRARYYTGLLGSPRKKDVCSRAKADIATEIRDEFADVTMNLRERGWKRILEATAIRNKLSLSARDRLDREFDVVCKYAFTYENIHAFLDGLIANQSTLQNETLVAVFDLFAKYHSHNTLYYMGWKSNDRHRTVGMRLKSTRFVLPHFPTWSRERAPYELVRCAEEIDKAFALLDGRMDPEFGLASLLQSNGAFSRLCAGERLHSDYFDIRYYPGRGTAHFFPTRKDLVDRLNRVVGRLRQWLPPPEQTATDDFWTAYDNAEKFTPKLLSCARAHIGEFRGSWMNPMEIVARGSASSEHESEMEAVDAAFTEVYGAAGLDVSAMLGSGSAPDTPPALPLPAPATE